MFWFIYFFCVRICKQLFFTDLNSYLPRSTMGAINPLKVLSYALMMCSESHIFNPNAVNISLSKIMSNIYLVEWPTWQFHVTVLVALSSGKVKSIITFILVVTLATCVWNCTAVSFLGFSFAISLLIIIVELHTLSNRILKTISLPFGVFVHPCRIGE